MEWSQAPELPHLTQTLHLSGCHFGAKPPGWSYARHHHYLFELIYCREGEVAQDVGEERLTLSSGQWLLIRSGVPHATANLSDGVYGFFNLHFDFDDAGLREGLCRSPYMLLDGGEAESLGLHAHAEAIERALGSGGAGQPVADPLQASVSRLRIQAHALELVSRIAELALVAPVADARRSPVDAATVGSATLAHAVEEQLRLGLLGEGRTIRDIASALGVSPGRCAKAFSEVYGLAPRQYLSRLVLNEAKRLLLSTDKPIGEIADELRFESASHFSRQFRRWTGTSPSAYRPKHLR